MVLPGRPANFDNSRARAYCARSICGLGLFGYFFSVLSYIFSFSLSVGEMEILSQEAVKSKNNQPTFDANDTTRKHVICI